MRTVFVAAVLAVSMGAAAFVSCAVEAKTDDSKKVPATITPVMKNKDRHEAFMKIVDKGDIDLLFLGDSITDGWRSEKSGAKRIFDDYFSVFKSANFGVSGDRTQHVLWRLQNGELEGIQPKLIVLMIGTNNKDDSKEDVALGIKTIIDEIHKRSKDSKVLLLGIFPRGEKADDKMRAKNEQVNALIAKFDDGGTVKYMDIGDKFLDSEKIPSKELMPDFLHPNARGYQIWADAILPTVKAMLK